MSSVTNSNQQGDKQQGSDIESTKVSKSSTCKVSICYFVVFGRKLDRHWLSLSGTADGHLRVH